MQSWLKVNLGDALLASEKLTQIEQQISKKYQDSNAAKEIAAFIRHESEGCLHCQVIVYFPPEASVIAKTFNATSCAKPSFFDLSLLAGNEESWRIYFPKHKDQ